MSEPVLTSHVFPLPPGVIGSAEFSPDHTYRYLLERTWGHDLFDSEPVTNDQTMAVMLMNPSAARADVDDSSVRKVFRLAERLGLRRLWVVNAFGICSTSPKILTDGGDIVGPENDATILRVLNARPGLVYAAWGVIDAKRDIELRAMLNKTRTNAVCFGLTDAGYPRHALYAKTSVQDPFPIWSVPRDR